MDDLIDKTANADEVRASDHPLWLSPSGGIRLTQYNDHHDIELVRILERMGDPPPSCSKCSGALQSLELAQRSKMPLRCVKCFTFFQAAVSQVTFQIGLTEVHDIVTFYTGDRYYVMFRPPTASEFYPFLSNSPRRDELELYDELRFMGIEPANELEEFKRTAIQFAVNHWRTKRLGSIAES